MSHQSNSDDTKIYQPKLNITLFLINFLQPSLSFLEINKYNFNLQFKLLPFSYSLLNSHLTEPMNISQHFSQSSSQSDKNIVQNDSSLKQQLKFTTPNKKYSFKKDKSQSSHKKLLLTQSKHSFHSKLQQNTSKLDLNQSAPNTARQNRPIKTLGDYEGTFSENSTPIKQISNSQQPLPNSPFNKNCFNSKSTRTVLTVNQIKKNQQNTSSTKHLTRSMEFTFSPCPKKVPLSSRQNSTIQKTSTIDPSRSIVPTHYTSVKLFMSSKFKKGIKEKLPVNILAFPETINQKQTTDSVLSSSCVRNLRFEDTILVKQQPLSKPVWSLNFKSKYINV